MEKENFKKLVLEKIEEYKTENIKHGLCLFLWALHLPKTLLIKPLDCPKYGYRNKGEENTIRFDGFWWPINKYTCTIDEWYAPRIEYLKNL